jgi:hypothetical protein
MVTHTWGECAARGKTSATYPASSLPHNCMGRFYLHLAGCYITGNHEEGCNCAWCGEPFGEDRK